jgi:hypothetical protein
MDGAFGPRYTAQVVVMRVNKKLYRKKVLFTKFALPVTLVVSIT